MKSVWCTVWVLGALLVFATLDAQPDPPAVNPRTALNKVVQPHAHVCGVAAPHCESVVAASHPLPRSLVTSETSDTRFFGDQIDLAVQAADSSPPSC